MNHRLNGTWKGRYMHGNQSTSYNGCTERMTIVTGADGGFTGDGDDEHGYFIVSEGSFTAPNWLFWKLYYPKTKKAYEYRATLQADGNEIYGTYLDSAEGGSNKFMLSRVSLPGKEFDLVQIPGFWTGQYKAYDPQLGFYNGSITRTTLVTDVNGHFLGDGEDDFGYFVVSDGLLTAPNWLTWKQRFPSRGATYEYRATPSADGKEINGTWLDTVDGVYGKFKLDRFTDLAFRRHDFNGVWEGRYTNANDRKANIRRLTVVTDPDGRFSGDGEDDHGYFILSEGAFVPPNRLYWKQDYTRNEESFEYASTINSEGNVIQGTWSVGGDGASKPFRLLRVGSSANSTALRE